MLVVCFNIIPFNFHNEVHSLAFLAFLLAPHPTDIAVNCICSQVCSIVNPGICLSPQVPVPMRGLFMQELGRP
jgi:hypothetical protein